MSGVLVYLFRLHTSLTISACSGKQFDVNGAILKALSGLLVDLAVDSNVKLDDCKVHCEVMDSDADNSDNFPDATPLAFNQLRVPAIVSR